MLSLFVTINLQHRCGVDSDGHCLAVYISYYSRAFYRLFNVFYRTCFESFAFSSQYMPQSIDWIVPFLEKIIAATFLALARKHSSLQWPPLPHLKHSSCDFVLLVVFCCLKFLPIFFNYLRKLFHWGCCSRLCFIQILSLSCKVLYAASTFRARRSAWLDY